MKFLKWFFIVVAILLAIFILGAFLIPKDWQVSRAVVIKAPVEVIHGYVSDLQAWQKWSPWNQEKDPSLSYKYEGSPGVGMKSLWTSDKMGSGFMQITQSDPTKGITYDLFIDMGMQSNLTGSIAYNPVADGIEVTWTDNGNSGNNIIKRWMSLLISSMLGKELEQGLEKLKSLSEAH
jgi:hypothetical protein